MTSGNTLMLYALLGISAVFFLWPLISGILRLFSGTQRIGRRFSKVIGFSVCLLCSLWALWFAAEYYAILMGQSVSVWYEALLSGLFQAIDVFGVDGDYVDHIYAVRDMVGGLTEQNTVWIVVSSLYVSVLDFIAPIMGGAIFLELLVSVFPRVRFWVLRKVATRPKFYFSRLNKESVTLAKSVLQLPEKNWKRPVIVFTGATPAQQEEFASQLSEIKYLGAVCVPEDICRVVKNKFGQRKFFLLGQETENLQELTELASADSIKLQDAEIYLFCKTDAYSPIEQRVCQLLREAKGISEERLPVIVPVRSYRNLIVKMLVSLPLYEPLLHKEADADGKKDLNVTILGTGAIGTEMFLNTYWIGQMLDTRLQINVVSQEKEEVFWGRIDCMNPEIRHTATAGDDILKINGAGELAEPYCKVNYIACDVHNTKFMDLLQPGKQEASLLQTDYFFVALGADEENMSVANLIRRQIGQYHAGQEKADKTIITYVVYDSQLAQTLNGKTHFCSCANQLPDIYMQAVGALEQVYSADNVFMTQEEPLAQKLGQAYWSKQNEEIRAKTSRKRMKEDYNHWSDRARASHRKYKLYSMGVYHKSVFETPGADSAEYLSSVLEAGEKCTDLVKQNDPKQMDRMAWLEHRRWNAFLRVYGFRHSDDYDTYADPKNKKSYKNMEMKLHPCLVECDCLGMRLVETDGKFVCPAGVKPDLLDELTCKLSTKGFIDYDFKLYDYPCEDFKE